MNSRVNTHMYSTSPQGLPFRLCGMGTLRQGQRQTSAGSRSEDTAGTEMSADHRQHSVIISIAHDFNRG